MPNAPTTASRHHESAPPPRRFLLPALLLALAAAGCDDMPVIQPQRPEAPLSITLGPYVTEAEDGRPTVRFHTNRHCIAGVRLAGPGGQRVFRAGFQHTRHAVTLHGLEPGATRVDVFLDDFPVRSFSLSRPGPGTRTVLGLLGGGREAPQRLAMAGRQLAAAAPHGLLLLHPPPPLAATEEAWQEGFFQPLGEVADRARLFFLPGLLDTEARALLDGLGGRGGFWSVDVGAVHIIFLEGRLLRDAGEREALLAWLEEDLRHRPPGAAWTVVASTEPLLGARFVNLRGLEALGGVLERRGVDLVVSGGEAYYHRSVPVRRAEGGPIRYIVSGGLSATDPVAQGREYTAALASEPHVALLRADEERLEWTALDVHGRTLDYLDLRREGEGGTGEPVLVLEEILDGAVARQRLQQEIRMAAVQACRAVAEPRGEVRLPVVVANPTNEPFAGTLRWEPAAGGLYEADPARHPFRLEPGRRGRYLFRLRYRGGEAPPPTLVVDAPEVGTASQELLLTRRKRVAIPPFEGPYVIDGAFLEPFWLRAADLSDFVVFGTGAEPTQVIHARIAYAEEGLLVGLRCGERLPAETPARFEKHDSPLHREESVEVFLDPRREGREYAQFAVNLAGTTLDRSGLLGLAWSPHWRAAVQHAEEYYDVEILIPYATLGLSAPPQPGAAWGLNLTRNDYPLPGVEGEEEGAPPAPEILQWAPTFGSNARSGLYGEIVFSDAGAAGPAP